VSSFIIFIKLYRLASLDLYVLDMVLANKPYHHLAVHLKRYC